ncbi:MAG: diguanylate cyclase [Oligoflexia bacterium]|nr:diguanylate cyclase [Oligoflexia bacterium]
MARVLVVDDDRDNVELMTQFLSQESHNVQGANDADGTLHRVKAWKPHLLLLDVNLAGSSGLDLIAKVRASSPENYVSIVLVSANNSLEDVIRGLQAGADDYLTKPFRPQELAARIRTMLKLKEVQDSLRRATHRIEELASLDPVTGLLNFQSFYRKAEEEILRARRFRKPISLLAVDLDGFAVVNRESGFPFGNYVLREAGKRIKSCVRSMDIVGHVAGDEYLVLLVETDLATAEYLAERIRDSIRSQPLENPAESGGRSGMAKAVRLTCSVGAAGLSYEQGEQGIQDLLRIGLEAVHSAKQGGRDRVEVYSYA